MSAGASGPQRRRKLDEHASAAASEVEMTEVHTWASSWAAANQPFSSSGGIVYNMDDDTDKLRLQHDIWTKDFAPSFEALRAANPELVTILESSIANQSKVSELLVENKSRLVDGILLNICRAQSQKKMPLVTAALSILDVAHNIPREFHDVLTLFFKGSLASETWTEDFLSAARAFRPPPSYEPLDGVVVATFDNLSMNVDYSSYVREGEGGYKLDMTNWFTTSIPQRFVSASFNAAQLFQHGIFRSDLSLDSFCRSFYLNSADIVANQRQRWTRFLHAAANGRLLNRPNTAPQWRPYKIYHEPMFGRLQSSYADVEYELTEMTRAYRACPIMFVAGDGLALMRLNHLLATYPEKYIDQTPCVIPIQGEHPHGLFHVMHCYWRLNRQFIMWCAKQLGNKQVIEDPNVSVFNVHRYFFLNVLTRACAEFINEIAATPGAEDLDDPVPFLRKAEANIDFAWICHFAHDAGFMVLDFLQSVRGNSSDVLDILWREFFASAHSGTANKTQYVPMAIMRVFWGCALVPALNNLYHIIRTIPSGAAHGCGVGWDWAVEMLNAAIKAHVQHHVSEQQIKNFVANWALLEVVQERLRDLRNRHRNINNIAGHGPDVTNDVEKLKSIFRRVIGRTWAEATARNTNSHVTEGPQRQMVPWREVRGVMTRAGNEAPHAYVRRHVFALTPFFAWR